MVGCRTSTLVLTEERMVYYLSSLRGERTTLPPRRYLRILFSPFHTSSGFISIMSVRFLEMSENSASWVTTRDICLSNVRTADKKADDT
jgi:hypothetical protein